MDSTPTQAGFLAFLRGVAGISSAVLPDNSPAIPAAYEIAIETVNLVIAQASPLYYTLAVYNLGTDRIINFAPDVPNAPDVAGSTPPAPYFANLRNKWNVYGFVPGVIQESHDEATGSSYVVPDQFKLLTIADLQDLKTPFGRNYLGIAQRYGSIFALT